MFSVENLLKTLKPGCTTLEKKLINLDLQKCHALNFSSKFLTGHLPNINVSIKQASFKVINNCHRTNFKRTFQSQFGRSDQELPITTHLSLVFI